MKANKKTGLILLLMLITSVSMMYYTEYIRPTPEETIEAFINKRSDLYQKKEVIIDLIQQQNYYQNIIPIEEDKNPKSNTKPNVKEKLHKELKDLKSLLTQGEYERLLYNRALIDKELLQDKYDTSEIDDIKFTKMSEEKPIYIAKYSQKLYKQDKLKEEKLHMNEFILIKENGKWIISHIK